MLALLIQSTVQRCSGAGAGNSQYFVPYSETTTGFRSRMETKDDAMRCDVMGVECGGAGRGGGIWIYGYMDIWIYGCDFHVMLHRVVSYLIMHSLLSLVVLFCFVATCTADYRVSE